MTDVTGADGRSDVTGPLGALVSFLGFFDIFSLRCSLPMRASKKRFGRDVRRVLRC